jgi:MFS family permease
LIGRVFSAFRHRDFRLMWLGACTSSIGTWMQRAAQSWLVLQLSGKPFLLGLDSFLGNIPILLFSLVGGVVADRVDRRRVLLGSQLVQMTSAFLLAGLYAAGRLRVEYILALSFVNGVAQAFGGPAYQALLPSLVGQGELKNALAMNSAQFNVARLIGPVLSGLALTGLGAAWCFGLNGVSFVAVIVSLVMIRTGFTPGPASGSMLESMRTGFDFIRRREGMVSLIVLAFLMTMLGAPLLTFLPVMARDVFHGGPKLYTTFLSVSAAGSIAGALVVAGLGQGRNQGRQALTLLVLVGLLMAGFGLSRSLALSLFLLFFSGGVMMAAFTTIGTLIQLIVSDEMRGRVMSVYNVAFRGGMPMGDLVTGSLTGAVAAPQLMAANGVLLALVGLYYRLRQKKVAAL